MTNDLNTARYTLIYTFITNLDYMVVLPLVPILLSTNDFHMRDGAFLLSLRAISSLVGTILVPIFFASVYLKISLFIITFVKIMAFILLLFSGTSPIVLFFILSGFGSGILRPIVRSVLSTNIHGVLRKRYFQYLFVTMNAAMVLGPFLSKVVERFGCFTLCFSSLILIEGFSGALIFLFKRKQSLLPAVPWIFSFQTGVSLQYSKVFKDNRLLWVLLLGFFSSFAMGVMISGFVLYAEANPSLGSYKNLFLSFEGFSLIICQLLIIPFAQDLSEQRTYTYVSILFGVSMGLSFLPLFPVVLFGLVMFSLAECFSLPQIHSSLSQRISPSLHTTAFSLMTILSSLGEASGSFCAGLAINYSNESFSPYYNFATIGVSLAFTFWCCSLLLTKNIVPTS